MLHYLLNFDASNSGIRKNVINLFVFSKYFCVGLYVKHVTSDTETASHRFPANFVIDDSKKKQKIKDFDHFYLKSNCKCFAIYNKTQFSFKHF